MSLTAKNATTYEVNLGDNVDNTIFGNPTDKALANINGSKWDDEAWVNLNFPDQVYSVADKIEPVSTSHWLFGKQQRVELTSTGVRNHVFDLNADVMEWAIEHETKPATNLITIRCSYPDEVYPARQGVICEPTPGPDAAVVHPRCEGMISFLARKTNGKYKAGGFKDLFVFEIIRKADGARQPCGIWNITPIDKNNCLLTCEIPSGFLDSCFGGQNPGCIVMGWGDTLGDSATPSLNVSHSEVQTEYSYVGASYQPSSNGTANNFYLYGHQTGGQVSQLLGGIHSSPSSTSPDGGSIHEEGDAEATVNSATSQWWSHTMPGTFEIQASTDYWIAWARDVTSGTGSFIFFYWSTNGTENDLHRQNKNWTTGTSLSAATATSTSVGDYRQAVYIDTTDVGGAGTPSRMTLLGVG